MSLSFDGIEDTADLGVIDVNGTGLTMASWFKASSYPGNASDPRIISKASGSGIGDHIFMLSTIENASGDIRLRMRAKINGSTKTLKASSGSLSVDQWYHAAATYDGSTMRLYLDGQEVGSLNVTGTVDQAPTVSVAIGSQPGGGNNFHGLIDDVRLLQRALTQTEVENIANGSATADPIPTEPGSLTGIALSQFRVDLNWEASTDNFGVVAYEIYRDSVLVAVVTGTSWTDPAPIGGSHVYEVEAVDADGFRSPAASIVVQSVSSQNGNWWDLNWPYRILLGVSSGEYDRTNKIVEMPVDFDQQILSAGGIGVFEPATIRCHEVTVSGDIIAEVSCQADNADSLTLQVPGYTASQTGRYFHVYFEAVGGSGTAATGTQLVDLTDNVMDEGQSSYRISTSAGTYYYHKQGAGFSSLVDTTGIDWIGYNANITGGLGTFRGIPNMVPASLVQPPSLGALFHPGATSSTSTLINTGPVKATFRSETINGLWEVQWDIYPNHATMTVLKADMNYWVLYEGVPGGTLDSGDSSVRSFGAYSELSAMDTWGGDLPGDEWVYMTASEVTRSFYMAHLDEDFAYDSYRPASVTSGQMTILGFGRQNAIAHLSRVPERFNIGLIDTNQFTDAKQLIESTSKPIVSELSPVATSP